MRKRLWAGFLSIALVLTMMPAALADEAAGEPAKDVAQIGETSYATLNDAVQAAGAGDTIALLEDCTLTANTIQKAITVNGNGKTITVPKQKTETGGLEINASVAFHNTKLAFGNPDNWSAVLGENGVLTLDEGSQCTFQTHGLYAETGAAVDVTGGSKLRVENAVYTALMANKGYAALRVSGGSAVVVDHAYQGNGDPNGINNFRIQVQDSDLIVTNCENQGLVRCWLTLDHAEAEISGNDTGITGNNDADVLVMKNGSSLTMENNKTAGIFLWGGKVEVQEGNTLTITGTGKQMAQATDSRYAGALAVYYYYNNYHADVNFADGATINLTDNGVSAVNSDGEIYIGKGTTITGNGSKTLYGGGIQNRGKITVADGAALYNNHAEKAGDDIYNTTGEGLDLDKKPVAYTGTINFCKTGGDWILDDCDHAITGWFADEEEARWSAHGKPLHTEAFGATAAEGALALKAAHGLLPAEENGEISKSKTATNLDSNGESQITLSIPSQQEQLVSDVVFVLDKSTSAALEEQALTMLQNLKQQVTDTGAKVQVGVVIFNKEAHVANNGEFWDLATDYDKIQEAVKEEIRSGTNTHAGLLAGKKMLDDDTATAANRKYMIFVSDGITYMYNPEPTATAWSFMADVEKNFAGPDNWNSKYGDNQPPTDWQAWRAQIGKQIEAQGTAYEYPYGGTPAKSTPVADYQTYANSIDKALYLTHQVYESAKGAGYHCYAMAADSSAAGQYPWAASFMTDLAEGKTVSFDQIQNDIYYLCAAGTKVEDFIGYTDGENGYNFDFVNDPAKLTMAVGDTKLAAEKLTENQYGFGRHEKDGEIAYDYVLTYEPGNGQDTEHFVWDIHVPISSFAPVSLTYSVKLTNPKTQAGTYGEFDPDGSQKKAGLYTNNRATLYPVDSNGETGLPENFAKPTVSYTVGAGQDTAYTIVRKYITILNGKEQVDATITGSAISTKVGMQITAEKPEQYEILNGVKYEYAPKDSVTSLTAAADQTKNVLTLVYTRSPQTGETSGYQIITRYYVNNSLEYTVKGDIIGALVGDEITVNPETEVTYQNNRYRYQNSSQTPQAITLKIAAGGGEKNVIYLDYYRTRSSGGGGGGSHTTPSDLDTVHHYAYIIGRDDGKVHPEAEITRAEVATIFFRLLTDESRSQNWSNTNGYSDVRSDRWFHHAVSTLSKMQILNGYTDGTFQPDQSITRAEFVKIAVSFFHSKYTGNQQFYSDIAGNWAEDYIRTAASIGLVNGYPDGTFRPNQKITRAEAVTIVNNTIGRKPAANKLTEKDMITWPDNQDESKWYYAGMQEATNSHNYKWNTGKTEESWSKILEIRDWAALEREWADNNASHNPGDVISSQ